MAARTRRTLIDIAKRRQKPGSGSLSLSPDTMAGMQWPDLGEDLGDLPWAVVGAVATRLYVAERATSDLDAVVLAKDARRAENRLKAAGFTQTGKLSVGGTSWLSPDNITVDLIYGSDDWWPAALQAASGNHDQQGLPVLPLPYLVMMKLLAGRTIDVGDVTRMLGAAGDEALQEVRGVTKTNAPHLAEDLESLIALGKLEFQSPDS